MAEETLIEDLRGDVVRVQSEEGHRFEGRLARWRDGDDAVLLRNARELPGERRYPLVYVSRVDWIASNGDANWDTHTLSDS